jgi:CRP-like cAMP-binding protein
MYSNDTNLEAAKQFSGWHSIINWGQTHYRDRIFQKDERIPTRSGLLYLVELGAIRLVDRGQLSIDITKDFEGIENSSEIFLGFIQAGEAFEIVSRPPFKIEAFAHIEPTKVIWLYWHDIDNWNNFRRELLDLFRYRQQRQLLWLSTLGQQRAIDRLFGFLSLLIEDYGTPCELGKCLPYYLTHAQIGSAIGSTRVTVTRLMGQLKKQGLIVIQKDNLICLPR